MKSHSKLPNGPLAYNVYALLDSSGFSSFKLQTYQIIYDCIKIFFPSEIKNYLISLRMKDQGNYAISQSRFGQWGLQDLNSIGLANFPSINYFMLGRDDPQFVKSSRKISTIHQAILSTKSELGAADLLNASLAEFKQILGRFILYHRDKIPLATKPHLIDVYHWLKFQCTRDNWTKWFDPITYESILPMEWPIYISLEDFDWAMKEPSLLDAAGYANIPGMLLEYFMQEKFKYFDFSAHQEVRRIIHSPQLMLEILNKDNTKKDNTNNFFKEKPNEKKPSKDVQTKDVQNIIDLTEADILTKRQ